MEEISKEQINGSFGSQKCPLIWKIPYIHELMKILQNPYPMVECYHFQIH